MGRCSEQRQCGLHVTYMHKSVQKVFKHPTDRPCAVPPGMQWTPGCPNAVHDMRWCQLRQLCHFMLYINVLW